MSMLSHRRRARQQRDPLDGVTGTVPFHVASELARQVAQRLGSRIHHIELIDDNLPTSRSSRPNQTDVDMLIPRWASLKGLLWELTLSVPGSYDRHGIYQGARHRRMQKEALRHATQWLAAHPASLSRSVRRIMSRGLAIPNLIHMPQPSSRQR